MTWPPHQCTCPTTGDMTITASICFGNTYLIYWYILLYLYVMYMSQMYAHILYRYVDTHVFVYNCTAENIIPLHLISIWRSRVILYVYVTLCLIAYVFVFVHVCVNLFKVTCVGVFLFVLLRCVRKTPAKVLFESEKYIIGEQIYYH